MCLTSQGQFPIRIRESSPTPMLLFMKRYV
ncbi:hypothetical protein NXF25_012127 [Crotalus adamanteus]|uniref:Uncharacterized protein n=1 Tax=Crotalus adamanteus TaxID=8729 RepID=A0AAW1BH99_CROAD